MNRTDGQDRLMTTKLRRHATTGALIVAAALTAPGVAACASTTTSPAAQPTTADPPPTTEQADHKESAMRIQLTIGAASATARLYDNASARDFVALLPVTIRLHDLGGREKAGALPRALTAGRGQSEYRAGQLGYWAPNHDLAIYYHEDGFQIPNPGIVMIGEIESGLDSITSADDDTTLTISHTDS